MRCVIIDPFFSYYMFLIYWKKYVQGDWIVFLRNYSLLPLVIFPHSLNTIISNEQIIVYGGTQGSVRGPLCFNIYVNGTYIRKIKLKCVKNSFASFFMITLNKMLLEEYFH